MLSHSAVRVRWIAIVGAGVALFVASALTIEIAEGLRQIDYWKWRRDWPTFLLITSGHAIRGGLIGLGLAGMRLVAHHRRVPTSDLNGGQS